MCRTTSTARPSRRPGRAAPPLLTPSVGSRPRAGIDPLVAAAGSGAGNAEEAGRVYRSKHQSRKAVRMSEKIANLTEATFDEVVNSSAEPVIVDFWAEWCGPCKMVAPILAEIADEQDGKVKVAKLNVDESPAVAQRFGVMSIPTMIVFRDGEIDRRIVGAKGKAQLMAELGL
ncbi:MAG: thioredoxin [Acidimicrobiales bacterium]